MQDTDKALEALVIELDNLRTKLHKTELDVVEKNKEIEAYMVKDYKVEIKFLDGDGGSTGEVWVGTWKEFVDTHADSILEEIMRETGFDLDEVLGDVKKELDDERGWGVWISGGENHMYSRWWSQIEDGATSEIRKVN
jgi:hypothetical protein